MNRQVLPSTTNKNKLRSYKVDSVLFNSQTVYRQIDTQTETRTRNHIHEIHTHTRTHAHPPAHTHTRSGMHSVMHSGMCPHTPARTITLGHRLLLGLVMHPRSKCSGCILLNLECHNKLLTLYVGQIDEGVQRPSVQSRYPEVFDYANSASSQNIGLESRQFRLHGPQWGYH